MKSKLENYSEVFNSFEQIRKIVELNVKNSEWKKLALLNLQQCQTLVDQVMKIDELKELEASKPDELEKDLWEDEPEYHPLGDEIKGLNIEKGSLPDDLSSGGHELKSVSSKIKRHLNKTKR